ncbi:alpha,alpha-trehalase TreF [Trinickia sp. EG282A]|uniref:alpha,alpha-trehalase TreF n=1 Tax=Trinickia sp. EG282A TaxID=3237013 RepID=UPI0034D28B77
MSLSVARRLAIAVFLLAGVCHGAEPIQTFDVPRSAVRSPPAAQGNPHAEPSPVEPVPPSDLYGDLYRAVELGGVFPDSKTFADMIPNAPPPQIVSDYQASRGQPGFDLRGFVDSHFSGPPRSDSNYVSDPNQNVVEHIDTLWNVLRRGPDAVVSRWSSLLPLPKPYLVPGGRFDEVYYWDSYFIMLGLEQSGRHDLAVDELDDFATLIDRYGHIPNGNRTYYLSRSQPPFFAQMVGLIANEDGDKVYLRYLPELKAEYTYWMDGSDTLAPGHAFRHLVRLPDGTLLNRYWDDRDTPRDESYREDVATAQRVPQRNAGDLWRNLRAGGETGWDFSSRWFADDRTLSSIDVTSLIPVDLNALLYGLETTLAKAYRVRGDAAHAENMQTRARSRADAIRRVLWDPKLQAFGDYNFVERTLTHRLTAATVYPLFAGVATRDQARKVASAVRRGLLRPGGMATTQARTGQQWDEPDGWAPLQYLAVTGLRRYGESDLAREIATRWIRTTVEYYVRTGKLVEKYDIDTRSSAVSAGGGEYPLQDGFGWTNGTLRVLIALYPDAVDVKAARPAAASASFAGAAPAKPPPPQK